MEKIEKHVNSCSTVQGVPHTEESLGACEHTHAHKQTSGRCEHFPRSRHLSKSWRYIHIFVVVVCFLIYLEQLLWERESQMYEELQSVAEGTNSVIGPSHFSGQSLKVVCTLDKSSELQKILIPVTHNHRPWFDWSGVWPGHIIWSGNPTSV